MNEILRASSERARLLYQECLILLQLVDQAGKSLVAVSDQWLAVLGYTRTEVLGRNATDFLTETSRRELECSHWPQLQQTGRLEGVSCTILRKSGEPLSVLLSAVMEQDEQGGLLRWVMTLSDSAHQPQAEQLLQSILGETPPAHENYFQTLVSHLADAFQVRSAFVTECVNRALTRVRTVAFLAGRDFVENIEYDLTGTPCEGVIGGAICYYPEQLGTLFPIEQGQESYLGAPCYDSRGNLLGHLAVLDDKPMQRAPQDLALLELFAARAGAALERKQAAERTQQNRAELSQLNQQLAAYNQDLARLVAERTSELERRRQVAEGLRDLLTILNSNRPLSDILGYIVGAATQLLGTSSGAIYGWQPQQKIFTVQATCGLPPAYATNLTFAAEQSVLGQAIVKRQPVVISNIAAALAEQPDSLDTQRQALLTQHYHTLLTVPLLRQGSEQTSDTVYGAIALYYPTPRSFSDEEIGLVVAFANQAALAIENAQLRQEAEQAAIMAERSRLARELHDSVTQSLYSMTLLSEGWRRLAVKGELQQVDQRLAELGELSQQALKEMRLLVHELLPPALEKEGLVGALYQRLAAVEKRAGIDARLVADEVFELPPLLEAALYRIAQEALNNALKHADASAVTINLRTVANQIMLEIADNGKGFPVEPRDLQHDVQRNARGDAQGDAQSNDRGGLGLVTMRERAVQLGGILSIDTAPGQGTTVRVQLDDPRTSDR
ncbi:MAG: GAF domain-containing protein [Caldilineaceae bacterium]